VLAEALGFRLQHLLVDEMQDTSSSQYGLIESLTQGWDGQSQTVFLVGDPKQSIYLFRQARVEHFLGTMTSLALGELPLGCLRLTANFRSQATLVAAFNEDFERVFPARREAMHPAEVPFVAAAAIRSPGPETVSRIWHIDVFDPEDPDEPAGDRSTQRRREAAALRQVVEDWRARPQPSTRSGPWKIAVLVRNRSHLEEVVRIFQQEPAIPFRAVNIDPLKERAEVQDLVALTRALLHPADRVAWLAVLHAPWCGFGLNELHILTGSDDTELRERSLPDLIAERGHLLDDAACLRLERLWPIFMAAAGDARSSLAKRVERTWRSLGGDVWLSATERSNAGHYLQLIEEIERRNGTVDLALLHRQLGRLYAAPPLQQEAAVDLLTIHSAKGLEWDVVLVPGLERMGKNDTGRLLSWLELDDTPGEEGAAHVLLAPIRGKGEDSQELNRWIDGVHREREAAERKRLFYVACTRAREELHLFATPGLNAARSPAPAPNSLLKAAWPAAEPIFASLVLGGGFTRGTRPADGWSGLTVVQQPAKPASGVLYRLPPGFDPEARLRVGVPLPYGTTSPRSGAEPALFERPEGGFAVRAFGSAVHLFLEALTRRRAEGSTVADLLDELVSWTPRIAAVLRGEGLPPAQVERLAERVHAALRNTLTDAEGAWLLEGHPGSASEFALTACDREWGGLRTIRIDRLFRAGTTPFLPGEDCLWIVDYKTSTQGGMTMESFLEQEREQYGPQLEAYARVLRESWQVSEELRLALYYPLLPKLVWWK